MVQVGLRFRLIRGLIKGVFRMIRIDHPAGAANNMSKKSKKDKKSRPHPKPNRQIPISSIKPFKAMGQSPYLQNPRQYSLHGCWIMEGWQETGLTPVVVARLQDDDRIMFAV
jgi:hypothetical protein